MSNLPFPLSFKRQLPYPLDADGVFVTTQELIDYLSSPLRYSGQIAVCKELEGSLFVLSNDRSTWIQITGNGGEFEDFIPITEKGNANGVATLNESGVIPIDQIPDLGLDQISQNITNIQNALNNLEIPEEYDDSELIAQILQLTNDKQDNLVSGVNLKTINGNSLLGFGNIQLEGIGDGAGGTSGTSEALFQRFTFVSDGSTTFDLGVEASLASLLVFIGGVFQTSQHYTVSGTDVVFAEPPPEGSKIAILRILSPDFPEIEIDDLEWGNLSGNLTDQTDLQEALDTKQDILESGVSIKTINGESILEGGNLEIPTGLAMEDFKEVSYLSHSFVSDGTTEYVAPFVVEDKASLLFIGGVFQPNSSYTLVGNTLSLDGFVPVGTAITLVIVDGGVIPVTPDTEIMRKPLGEMYPTNEFHEDGRRFYMIEVDLGNMPNDSTKTVAMPTEYVENRDPDGVIFIDTGRSYRRNPSTGSIWPLVSSVRGYTNAYYTIAHLRGDDLIVRTQGDSTANTGGSHANFYGRAFIKFLLTED